MLECDLIKCKNGLCAESFEPKPRAIVITRAEIFPKVVLFIVSQSPGTLFARRKEGYTVEYARIHFNYAIGKILNVALSCCTKSCTPLARNKRSCTGCGMWFSAIKLNARKICVKV